ncbi:MAG: hypothetical protein KZQ94_10465 [Candidatus Thiodiazotropha sp. (ex Troendleina suluensis)]|nr:hypothetical protein [Candidatus Thiodiazotropha sp. (ex Troendleina suluensis)]
MGIPTVYKSSDVGAPTLSGTAGAFIALLKACLVDGYGAQTPLGWVAEFEDVAGEKAVFRAATGSRHYYRFQHNAASGGTSGERIGTCEVYETMSDVDTGTGLWHSGYINASYYESAAATEWALIGDETGFYLWTQYLGTLTPANAGTYGCLSFFGDIIPADPLDTNIAAMNANKNQSYGSTINYFGGRNDIATATCVAYRDLSGLVKSGLQPVYLFSNNNSVFHPNRPNQPDDQRVLVKVIFNDDSGYFKAFFPGMYVSNLNSENLNQPLDLYETSYLLVTHRTTTVGTNTFLIIDQDWRA